jgi:hypothetical protein
MTAWLFSYNKYTEHSMAIFKCEEGRKTAQKQNANEKHAKCDHVKRKGSEKSSEAESLNI